MKKCISLIFLLLANIVLLAHSVIPHHHHNSVVCLSNTHCADSHNLHNHNHHHNCSDCNNEEHQHSATTECNLIKDILARFDNGNRQEDSIKNGIYLQFIGLYLSPNIDLLASISELEGLPFRQKPYLLSYYSTLIIHSQGLRAPPFC